MAIYQILVKLLDGDTRCLQFPSSTISGESLKATIHSKTGIPPRFQRLVTGSRAIHDETLISASIDRAFPCCALLLPLRGGKGGFGSLLRGAATKAGQKKTNNFDACRDMSGRRLRHVNAEKRLEEWRAEAEERKLEKIAEGFLRKKAKEVKKSNSKAVERYIEKGKEESERCMGEVEESVRQSFGLYVESKRKALPAAGAKSKRLKLWLGKNKVGESDTDDEDDDESDGEDDKSIVVDVNNQKDEAGSSGTVSGGQSDGESYGGGSDGSNLEEENVLCDPNGRSADGDPNRGTGDSIIDSDDFAETKDTVDGEPCSERLVFKLGRSADCDDALTSEEAATSEGLLQEKVDILMPMTCLPEILATSGELMVGSPGMLNEVTGPTTVLYLENSVSEKACKITHDPVQPEPIAHVEIAYQSPLAANCEEPLNFDNFNSASELESLGMERLKVELQANGLKCGGTMQERAARLFLLKTTPVDKLPKKVLAKPPSSGR